MANPARSPAPIRAYASTICSIALRRMIVAVSVCTIAFCAYADGVPVVLNKGAGVDLSRFYQYFWPTSLSLGGAENALAIRTDFLPIIRVTGGGAELPLFGSLTGTASSYAQIESSTVSVTDPTRVLLFDPRRPNVPCRDTPTATVLPIKAGHEVLETTNWYDSIAICASHQDPFNGGGNRGEYVAGHTWTVPQKIVYGAPVRRKAIDGGQYDASPMVTARFDLPWLTYHWGYRLGLVAIEANWIASNLSNAPLFATWPSFPDVRDNFELSALPPPWIEDDVVEYVNLRDFPKQPGGQFFYAVRASDKVALDATTVWQRTGKAFKSGGYVSVCRFYGGLNGGPNTHFYSADQSECSALKNVSVLSYEGQTFAVNMPMPAQTQAQAVPGALRDCPVKSKPLFRLYNNASAPGKDYVSNHRYVTERTDVLAAVAQGWVDEGHVMCVPE